MLSHNVLHGGPWSGFAGDGQRLERRMDLIADEPAALTLWLSDHYGVLAELTFSDAARAPR